MQKKNNKTQIPINLIYDTREQKPLEFKTFSSVYLQQDKLDCGDYSLTCHDMPNDEDSICIERKKDCNEFVRNLVAKWDQFKNELELMSKYEHKFILVCGDNNFEYLFDKGYIKVPPAFAMSRIVEIYTEYKIPTLFLGNRTNVELFIYNLCKKIRIKHGNY